jgi:hypothetical protein
MRRDPGADNWKFGTWNGDLVACSVWLYPTVINSGDDRIFISKDHSGGRTYEFSAKYVSGVKNIFRFRFEQEGGSQWHEWESTNHVFPLNTWTHIAWSWTVATGSSLSLYVNGVSEGGSWVVGNGNATPSISSAEGFVVGKWWYSTTNAWYGRVGDIIWYRNQSGGDGTPTALTLSRNRYTPMTDLQYASVASRFGLAATEPDLTHQGTWTANSGWGAATHPPTAFLWDEEDDTEIAVAAGVAGPLVNRPARLHTLVGGGLA